MFVYEPFGADYLLVSWAVVEAVRRLVAVLALL